MSHQQFYETVQREEEYISGLKSVSQYAKEVGKSERQIRRLCVDKKLLSFKIGNQWTVVGPHLEGEKR